MPTCIVDKFYTKVLHYLSACKPVPDVTKAKLVLHTDLRIGIYICNIGHVFPDGSRMRSIICNEDGSWSAIPPLCSGMDVMLCQLFQIVFTSYFTFVSCHMISALLCPPLPPDFNVSHKAGDVALQTCNISTLTEWGIPIWKSYCSNKGFWSQSWSNCTGNENYLYLI